MNQQYSFNDFYARKSAMETTSAQTIPEGEERAAYNEQTFTNENGTKSIIDKKSIFITIGVSIAILFFLNAID
jgi:hypothetical protein